MFKPVKDDVSLTVFVALFALLAIVGKAVSQESAEAEPKSLTPEALQKLIHSEYPTLPVASGPDSAVRQLKLKQPHFTDAPSGVSFSGVFALTNQYYFENTAQAIAPSTDSGCPSGRAVASVGTDRSGPWLRDLYDTNGRFDAHAPLFRSGLPVTSEQEPRTDSLLTKLPDGSLLAIRQGLTWESVVLKPAWWDEVTIQNYPNGARVGFFVWRSTDCGKTWTRLTIIDPINYECGRYAVPRPTDTRCAGGCFGGWDRPEVYTDPWTGYVYVTTNAAGGPIIDYSTNKELQPADSTHFLFRSIDGGKTWQQIFKFYAWTPIVISSTPDGRLYLYTVIGDQPTLFYSLLGSPALQFSPPKPVNYWVDQDGERTKIIAEIDEIYENLVDKGTNSISRISTDIASSKVRLTYPWVDAGRTAIAVVNVEVPSDTAEPIVTPVATFHSMSASNSILSSTFIDPDPTGATVARTNTSVLYWVEGSTLPTHYANVRYSIFQGTADPTSPATLGAPYRPTASVGHYMYGGSFFPPDGSFNYLAQWVQADGIRANIITIPPEPGPARFNAVWVKSNEDRPAVWGWARWDFDRRQAELQAHGYRLHRLDAFVLP